MQVVQRVGARAYVVGKEGLVACGLPDIDFCGALDCYIGLGSYNVTIRNGLIWLKSGRIGGIQFHSQHATTQQ